MQPDAPERADSFETYQRGVRWQRAIRGLTPLQRVDEESDRLDVARLEYDNREQGRAALSTTGADVALARSPDAPGWDGGGLATGARPDPDEDARADARQARGLLRRHMGWREAPALGARVDFGRWRPGRLVFVPGCL